MLGFYGGAVGIIYSIYTFEAPGGPEATLPVSPTVGVRVFHGRIRTYGPPKAVDREFIKTPKPPRPQNPKPLNPKIGFFKFFIAVLSPGRCLDGFVPHFSCRYTPSDPNFIIPDPKHIKFHEKVDFGKVASSQVR